MTADGAGASSQLGTSSAVGASSHEVAIPAGITIRPFDVARDYEPVAALITDTNLHDDLDWLVTLPQLRVEVRPGGSYDPEADARVAEQAGEVVGFLRVRSRERGPAKVVHRQEVWTTPPQRRRGIASALTAWSERRAREIVAAGTLGAPGAIHELSLTCDETNAASLGFAEALGYRLTRYSFEMRRPLDQPIPDAPLPDGLELRPVLERDHRRIWEADAEAFRDHWEAVQQTEADFRNTYDDSDLDTSLWQVAWDGEEVAGVVMNAIFAEENEKLGIKVGWLEKVSTRRPWRRRGVGAALIVASLRAFRDRGMEEASLGVDAENPTGALALYERLAFRRHRSFRIYRKRIAGPPLE
jgi:mycothiol synthase